ncbi:terminase large subunit domain-containing protein [Arthrobacter alpinus]|uniref:terminase large subunit domain-containing protein n=1 Tax=Arthrobacter alpinus TaxID=656366 RepID=UPI0016458387|nr:terminase large subunit [Arthrobacter alpinus]
MTSLTADTPEAWLATLGKAQPLYATRPTPGSKNELALYEKVAALYGIKLSPWQRYALLVMSELNPDGSYRFKNVLISVPRQSGKTLLCSIILTARSLKKPGFRAFYTAQTGALARERFFEMTDDVEKSLIGSKVQVRRAAGSSRIDFFNGSRFQPFVPNAQALHGFTGSLAIYDELFVWDEAQFNGLLSGSVPALQTKLDKQHLYVSTQGHAESTALNGLIDKGKLAIDDPETDFCFLMWGLADGLDGSDSEHWDFHPSLGVTITKEDIRTAQGTMSKSEFERAYMNRQTLTMESVFDLEQWDRAKHSLPRPKRSQVGIGYEIRADRGKSAIVAAYKHENKIVLKVLNNGTGSEWIKEYIPQYADAKPLAIGVDKHPQANVITDSLRMDYPHIDITQMSAQDFNTACASFKSLIEEDRIIHDGHLALRDAIATATTKPYGDRGFSFSHMSQPELIAAIAAVRMIQQVEVQTKPFLYFPDE